MSGNVEPAGNRWREKALPFGMNGVSSASLASGGERCEKLAIKTLGHVRAHGAQVPNAPRTGAQLVQKADAFLVGAGARVADQPSEEDGCEGKLLT